MAEKPHDYGDPDRAAEVQRDDEELMDQVGTDKEAAVVEGLVKMGREADSEEGGTTPPFSWQPKEKAGGDETNEEG